MDKIIEIIPDNIPNWAKAAMERGQLYIEMLTRIHDLEEALLWCGNSKDFQEDGIAYQGWLSICEPLIKEVGVMPTNVLTEI